jgi:hypothetical protein
MVAFKMTASSFGSPVIIVFILCPLPAHDTHRENYSASGTLGTVCASRAGVCANLFLKL